MYTLSVLYTVMCRVNATPIKIPTAFFCRNEKAEPQIHLKLCVPKE